MTEKQETRQKTTGIRQFCVTDMRTGDMTFCMWPTVRYKRADGGFHHEKPVGGEDKVSRTIAGLKYPVEAEVNLVPKGAEVNLPFGDIPLVVRVDDGS